MKKNERKAIETLIDAVELTRQLMTDVDTVTRLQEMLYELQDMIEPEDSMTGDNAQFGMGE